MHTAGVGIWTGWKSVKKLQSGSDVNVEAFVVYTLYDHQMNGNIK